MLTTVVRWLSAAAAAIALLVATCSAAHAAETTAMTDAGPPVLTVDGFEVTHLPAGLGERTSRFGYTWEDVGFRSLVWESRQDSGPGYRVDMTVHVLRGAGLGDTSALREFLTGYLERDPAQWQLDQVPVGHRTALVGDRDVFWLAEPGVAIWISTRPGRLGRADLLATARGVRPLA